MDKILFINACVRDCSRTLVLAKEVLKNMHGAVEEIVLENEDISPLNGSLLAKRDKLIAEKAWNDDMFCYSREFAEADHIVIAAPFWDLGFPSILRVYLEAVMVAGITFDYSGGRPNGRCRAKSLKYVTTAGGPIFEDFGYAYIKSLARNFFAIPDISCFRIENLDIDCIPAKDVLGKAIINKIK